MLNASNECPTKSFITRAKKDNENPYVMIIRTMFRSNLSLCAKGLLGYLLTLPNDWRVHPDQVAKTLNVGRDKIYLLLKELMEKGFCKRIQIKEAGKFSSSEYHFAEEPIFLCREKPCPEKPYTENQDTEKVLIINDPPFPEKPDTEKPHVTNIDYTYKETTTNNTLSELFFMFDGLNLQESEIQSLAKFSKDRILLAIAFVKDPCCIIKTTIIQTLYWHCDEKTPPMHPKKQQQQAKSKPIQEKIIERYGFSGAVINGIAIEIEDEAVLFYAGMSPTRVPFNLENLKKRILEVEKTLGIKPVKDNL